MKINNYLPLAIATLAIAAGNTALAGFPIPQQYSATPITFTLVLTTQGEGSYSNGEGFETVTSTAAQERIGNPQILQMLKNNGVIGNITGWRIVLVSTNDSGLSARDSDDGNTLVGFYLTKVGREPIDISQYIGFELAGYTTVTGPATTVYSDFSQTRTEDYSHSSFGALNIGLYEGYLVVLGNVKYKTLSTNTYNYDGPSESTHNINSFNISNAAGFYGYDGPYGGYLVTGKITGPATPGTPIVIYTDI